MKSLLTAELDARVRHIELRARRAVQQQLSGSWRSSFQGRGIEFSEVREYQDGDAASMVDWRLTARFGRPFVKLFTEKRRQSIVLAVDCSSSMEFSGIRSKREHVAEVCAALALSASRNRDLVGLLLHSGMTDVHLPPRTGRQHILRLVREVLAHESSGEGTAMSDALLGLGRAPLPRSVVFVISDLMSGDIVEALSRLVQRHEVIVLDVRDPLERKVPSLAPLAGFDLESGRSVRLGSSRLKGFEARAELARAGLHAACRRVGADVASLDLDEDYVPSLNRLFALNGGAR